MTSPLSEWNNVTISDMPFKLKLSQYVPKGPSTESYPSSESFHFIRLSALNAEFGEGPYSQIIELRKIDRGRPFHDSFINFFEIQFIKS